MVRSRTGVATILALTVMGCNAFGPGDDSDQNEVRVTVQALGADFVDADDGIRYEVTADTQFEGYSGLTEIAVGTVVEIEFEEITDSANRRALEIERDGFEDGN